METREDPVLLVFATLASIFAFEAKLTSIPAIVFVGVAAMLLIQMVYTYVPVMQQLFHSTSIGIGSWARIMLAGAIGFLIVEVEKKLRAG